ncbi:MULTISPECIES: hypothetical protein [Pseudomonas]|uniref:Uncharacterized protein n=1 Tax=Pseudomonas petroselini TaxID=2899822 RepID=A0ABS8QPT7_9PSED|nr:hypothetical protein [Pseudomonas sp. 39167]MCD7037672.1 hypothetical protein [Pseudomonas petroselini]MCM2380434.1 hypothetical protein [Pseudomonas marginalis]MCD7046935.1 hypothetical protein [Pseudomonas petroselini]MCD7066519.1 hypothetical protein [Pseudomonas petroselini]MCD7080102.1 hypothetical protein [Pseudomonas petroselini]
MVKQCLLAHGHTCRGENLPFAQHLRDVLGLQIADGTAQIMKKSSLASTSPNNTLPVTDRQVTLSAYRRPPGNKDM